MREGTSFRGARAAAGAAEKRTSRIASCLWILSPFPPHPTWWSLKASLAPWQIGHRAPSSNILRPSQYWTQSRNSQSWRWRPRALEGTTFNQSPAWGRAVELARTLVRRSGADVRRRLSDASSMQLERARCRKSLKNPGKLSPMSRKIF